MILKAKVYKKLDIEGANNVLQMKGQDTCELAFQT